MMRVAVDASCLNRAYLRGMGKYLWNVLHHACQKDGFHWHLFGDRHEFPMSAPDACNISVDIFEIPGYRFSSWEQCGLPWRARRCGADILHCTATTLPWWQPMPTVVTIHDTIPFETVHSDSQNTWYWRRLIPQCYRKAAAVITISNSSKKDILRLWPELESKLYVIPHGIEQEYLFVSPKPLSQFLLKQGIRSPYLLYLGGEIPRKRLSWAIKVFERLNNKDLQMVICGIAPDSKELLNNGISQKIRDKICIPEFIPESEMPRLYQNAVALLYPTLYEGFGLPALEAQATGTQVLFSAVGSLAELQGPGAIVLPTEDLDAWVRACQECLEPQGVVPKRNQAAREWARKFSWDESARRHLEVYNNII